jgi:glycosyltransferase involved in cell wall biosynthesis
MRIAFISGMSGFPWGGSEVLWSETANRLLDSGHAVFASVTRWPETAGPLQSLKEKGADIDERKWQVASRRERFGARVLRRKPVHPAWDPCWQKIVDFCPDLVCVSHGAALCGTDWMMRCHKAGISYVGVAQANFEQWWPDDGRAGAIMEAYLGAEKAFFVSEANLALFERQIGTSLPNGEVVCNPFNVRWDARPAWPVDDGMLRLACVARLEPAAKGQDMLFQVLAQPKWRERPVTVSLFGKGPWEMGLRRLAEWLGVADRVRFAGHVEDIEQVWRTHHALVLPSRYEGLPLSVVEAMLCGRPVIVTDVAGNSEPLEDNVTGFVAEAATARHLEDAMERAWRRRNDWHAIGLAAADSIRQRTPEDPAQVFANKLLSLCKVRKG